MKTLALCLPLFVACTLAFAQEDQPRKLPNKEIFWGRTLLSPWKADLSESVTLNVSEGWLRLDAYENCRAHVSRPVEQDLVTLSAKVTGCGTLLAAWDAENWCAVGKISPTPFGRFYTIETSEGHSTETLHRGCNIGLEHYVRLQIGKDCIRYHYSNDAKQWSELRTFERPKGCTSGPRLLLLGKYYKGGHLPLNDAPTSIPESALGAKFSCGFSELTIEPTPAESLQMTDAERALMGQKPIYGSCSEFLCEGKEASFEALEGLFPPFKYPREVVGVPGNPVDIGVNYLGRFDVSPWTAPTAWIEAGDRPVAFGVEGTSITRRLLDGYLPVLSLSSEHDGIHFEQTVFGWSQGLRADSDLMAYVRVKASVAPGKRAPRKLALVYQNGAKRVKLKMEPAGEDASELCFCFKYPEPQSAAAVKSEEFETRLAKVASFWKEQLARAERFDVPDKRVAEAYRAWLVYSLLNTDIVNGWLEPHDGSGFYEEMFGYSVSLHTMALDQFGLNDEATSVLATQLHFQQPDGLYVQACGLPDHGSLILALADHYAVTRDDAWLKSVAPQLVKACQWVVRQRSESTTEGVARGLIKFRPYNDYPQPVYNYLGNAYCCAGLESASQALKAIGMKAEADSFASEARNYREDLLASMDKAAFKDGDLTILPIEPDTHRLLKLSNNQGGDYYGLVASNLLELGFLPPSDKRALWITDMLEKRCGLIAGLCDFMEGIDHAYSYGYLMTQMQRGQTQKVLLGFWGMMAFGMTRDTYSPVEVTQIATGENHLTLPHLYSCTQQLRLLRNMLLREEGDTLYITQAIPRQWLSPGKQVGVTSAPTTFGPVSYKISVDGQGGAQVHLDPPTRTPVSKIRIRLRTPEACAIAAVKTTPEVRSECSGEDVTLFDCTRPVDIQVSFKAK